MSDADSIKEQGITLYNQHDYEAAARAFQQAKDAYAEADQHEMVAEMKVNIGLVHRELGEAQQALEMMQEALRTFEDKDDKMRMAQVLGNLGGVYQSLGDSEQAEMSYRKAANLFDELGEEILYSDTMMALGAMQIRGFNFFQGAATYMVALENRENLSGRLRIIKSLSNLVTRVSGGNPA
ncbi:MAG: tetratricopeptide repeat protein [Anaerolineae bacterium]|nr:tetratricopeptide repeat protein [Anaerolineae bacterium]MDQ7036274.1 tetratricopeptide repeat protein [Anaerolineae bacterium]